MDFLIENKILPASIYSSHCQRQQNNKRYLYEINQIYFIHCAAGGGFSVL